MSKFNGHSCHSTSSVHQTLEELDFERGPWYAAQHGDIERLDKLFNRAIHVDARDIAGYTALHYAARSGCVQTCKYLLNKGAEIDAVTKCGQATALHRAATAGNAEVVQLLIEEGADVTIKDTDGKTLLHRAAESGHKDICKFIIHKCSALKMEFDLKAKRPFDYANDFDLATILK